MKFYSLAIYLRASAANNYFKSRSFGRKILKLLGGAALLQLLSTFSVFHVCTATIHVDSKPVASGKYTNEKRSRGTTFCLKS